MPKLTPGGSGHLFSLGPNPPTAATCIPPKFQGWKCAGLGTRVAWSPSSGA